MKDKSKIPTLGAVRAAEDDEANKAKGATLLAKALGLLGIGAATPSAKMTKKTLTTKRVEMEESDDSEEEEEEEAMSTEKSSDGADSSDAESSAKSSEEEEEEEASMAEEKKAKRAKYEEEEEEARAVAKGWKAAIAAYAAATKGVDAYGIKGPKGLLKAAEKATGAKGASATLSALHGLRTKAQGADAAVIQRLAKVEAKATKIETTSRRERVESMVQAAKASGQAPTKALRAQLREHGNSHGTKALASLIASLPKVARTTEDGERIPHLSANGSPLGAPTAQQQVTEMAMADLDPEQRKVYEKTRAEIASKKNLNGAPAKGY